MKDLVIEAVVSQSVAESEVMAHHTNHDKAVDIESKIYIDTRAQYIIDEADINKGYCNGTENTQHGVNAEHITVAEHNIDEIRRAAIENREPILMHKSSDVNGPHDMHRGDELYQSKCYFTANSSLEECIRHAEKYPDSYINNSDAYFTIPKDQYEAAITIKNGGTPEGWSEIRVENFRRKIDLAEKTIGGNFEDRFKPNACTYEESFRKNNPIGNRQRRKRIEAEHKEAEEKIAKEFTPRFKDSFMTGLEAAGIAAVTVSSVSIIRNAIRSKYIFTDDYTKEDYEKLFKESGKAALIAGGCAMMTDYICRQNRDLTPYVPKAMSAGMMVYPHVINYFTTDISGVDAVDGFFENVFASIVIGKAKDSIRKIFPSTDSKALNTCGDILSTVIAAELYELTDTVLNSEIRGEIEETNKLIGKAFADINVECKEIIKRHNDSQEAVMDACNPETNILQHKAALNDLSHIFDGHKVNPTFDIERTKHRLFGNN